MKRLYLASSIDRTAESIAKDIGKRKLTLAFILTAAEVEEGDKKWLDDDRNGLIKAGFNLFDYTITNKKQIEIEKDLNDIDVIHVNGGNTFYLLHQVRKSGFDKWIKEELNKGKIYTASSAGTLIAGKNISHIKLLDDLGKAPGLKDFKGLNLVDTRFLVHWGSEFSPKKTIETLKNLYKERDKIVLLNDWQYVKVEDYMYKIVDVRD